jgi:hypothetical protein
MALGVKEDVEGTVTGSGHLLRRVRLRLGLFVLRQLSPDQSDPERAEQASVPPKDLYDPTRRGAPGARMESVLDQPRKSPSPAGGQVEDDADRVRRVLLVDHGERSSSSR